MHYHNLHRKNIVFYFKYNHRSSFIDTAKSCGDFNLQYKIFELFFRLTRFVSMDSAGYQKYFLKAESELFFSIRNGNEYFAKVNIL